MANVYCIPKDVWKTNRKLQDFSIYKGSLSREDVATLIETFESAIDEVPVEVISDVLKNSDDLFAFLVDTDSDGRFDFYKFLNDHYENNAVINPLNSKMMFPRNLSRGIFTEYESAEEDVEDDYDEEATGYMDEDDDLEFEEETQVYFMWQESTGNKFEIEKRGMIMGRSQKTAQFIIEGNSNISRNHARVFLSGGIPFIEDKGSANGTFLNGVRLSQGETKQLEFGDIVMLADEKFVVTA